MQGKNKNMSTQIHAFLPGLARKYTGRDMYTIICVIHVNRYPNRLSQTNAPIHIYTFLYIHTNTYSRIQTNTHAHSHICKHTRTFSNTYTQYVHTCTHMYYQAYTHPIRGNHLTTYSI